MRITTIELSIEELMMILHKNETTKDDTNEDPQPEPEPEPTPEPEPEPKPEFHTHVMPAKVERPRYEPTRTCPKKKVASFDKRIDIAKIVEGQEPNWSTVDDYNAAASRIGCHFTSVLAALRQGKDEVKGYKVKWHIPREVK